MTDVSSQNNPNAMTKPFNLKPLQELSQSKLEDATRDLGKLVAHEQEGARKLEILQNYRAEYEARFREALDVGIGMEAFRNYSAFMSRIDQAIAIQQGQVEQSRRNTSAGRQSWMQQRNRSKAFDALHDRHVATENRREARSEQNLSDERVTRKAWQSGTPEDDKA